MRPVNLLPEQHRIRRPSGRAGAAYAVLGVLGVLLVFTLVYALTANQVNSKRSDAVDAKQEAERLEARSAALGPFGDFAQIKQTRMSSVRQMAAGRFDWERLMRELAYVLPAGSWLQETTASVTGDLGAAGGGGSSSAGSSSSQDTSGQPSAELAGCTPRQSDVARMMVRLREVHRVSDVQLNESSRADTGGSAGGTGSGDCGKLYSFDVTVTFTSDAPEIPEGAKQVPARLGGGS
jgi:Tfp pilus assembly protein PilN